MAVQNLKYVVHLGLMCTWPQLGVSEVYLLQIFDMVNPLFVMTIHIMDKIMEAVVKDTHFCINTVLGHHLPVMQLLCILE
jgi:hypothetical protein